MIQAAKIIIFNKLRSCCINNLDLDIVGIAETPLKGCDILKVNGYHWTEQKAST
jgi:hypothetical protein